LVSDRIISFRTEEYRTVIFLSIEEYTIIEKCILFSCSVVIRGYPAITVLAGYVANGVPHLLRRCYNTKYISGHVFTALVAAHLLGTPSPEMLPHPPCPFEWPPYKYIKEGMNE
jgi:hypothetical protein